MSVKIAHTDLPLSWLATKNGELPNKSGRNLTRVRDFAPSWGLTGSTNLTVSPR